MVKFHFGPKFSRNYSFDHQTIGNCIMAQKSTKQSFQMNRTPQMNSKPKFVGLEYLTSNL